MTQALTDTDDWLVRLTCDEWMRAAINEYDRGLESLERRNARQAAVHARRAAGMAINALLRATPDPRFGRSYAEHLVAVATLGEAPSHIAHAAKLLVADAAKGLVSLGGIDRGPMTAARAVLAWCAEQLPSEG